MLMLFLFFPVQSCSAAQASSNSVIASSALLKDDVPIHRLVIMNAVRRRQANMSSLQTEFHTKLASELLRNGTTPLDTTELALWISALIALKENPRNYNSLDLVGDLLHRVKITDHGGEINPFWVLTLCNAHALLPDHLLLLTDLEYVNKSTAKQALSLKTLACAATLPNSEFRQFKYQDASEKIAAALAAKQTEEGSFGDIFSTALATKALTVYGKQLWRETAALDALQNELETGQTNVVKDYYITSAINAHRVNFLKDLYHGSYEPQRKVEQMYIYVHLAIRYENYDLEFSFKVQTPSSWSLLQILNRVAELSQNFKFSTSKEGSKATIFEVDGTANDPEKDLYWIICSKERNVEEFNLEDLHPLANERIELWYRTTKCPPVQREVTN